MNSTDRFLVKLDCPAAKGLERVLFPFVELIAVVILFIGVLIVVGGPHHAHLPGNFYEFLHVVVFLAGLYIAFRSYRFQLHGWIWWMIGVAFVFNPIMPLHFSPNWWVFLDILAIIILAVEGVWWLRWQRVIMYRRLTGDN